MLVVQRFDCLINAGRGEIERRDAHFIGHDNFHRTIDSAVHVEIAGERRHIRLVRVINPDAQFIRLTKFQM